MKRSVDRIRTTHVGSLIRSQQLLDLAAAAGKGDASADAAFASGLRDATVDVVRRQLQAGIDIVNDGEFGKSSWANYILDRVSGFEFRPDTRFEPVWLGRDRVRFAEFMRTEFPRGAQGLPGHACVAAIAYTGYDAIRRNIGDLKAALAAADIEDGFLTAVAPGSTGYDASDEFYNDERAYIFAIADALREEYLEIVNAGLLLQVDDAVLANMYDHLVASGGAEHYRRWAGLRIEALNHALRGIPPERVRYHICFGSWHVPHVADAPLDAIVDLMLQVNAGAYSIEAANVRHEHEWRVWQTVRLPKGRVLIPGVVTHHTTTVEHPQVVADRLIRFAGLVGKDNLLAGTDCGFAQIEGLRRVHPEVMWAKLETLAEGARLASRALWGRSD